MDHFLGSIGEFQYSTHSPPNNGHSFCSGHIVCRKRSSISHHQPSIRHIFMLLTANDAKDDDIAEGEKDMFFKWSIDRSSSEWHRERSPRPGVCGWGDRMFDPHLIINRMDGSGQERPQRGDRGRFIFNGQEWDTSRREDVLFYARGLWENDLFVFL